MVEEGKPKEVVLQFVWSDDLAQLLLDRGEATRRQVGHWASRPIGHRLPPDESPLSFARLLLVAEAAPGHDRRAS